MLERLEFTSRMKDYFDIYFLANTFDIDGRRLQEAIYETIKLLEDFLSPIYKALMAENEFHSSWNCGDGQWGEFNV